MLALSRFPDESIIIGHNVRVQVIRVTGGKVRLGIVAPPNVEVNREEIYKQKFGELPAALSNVAPTGDRPAADKPAGDDPGPYLQTR